MEMDSPNQGRGQGGEIISRDQGVKGSANLLLKKERKKTFSPPSTFRAEAFRMGGWALTKSTGERTEALGKYGHLQRDERFRLVDTLPGRVTPRSKRGKRSPKRGREPG